MGHPKRDPRRSEDIQGRAQLLSMLIAYDEIELEEFHESTGAQSVRNLVDEVPEITNLQSKDTINSISYFRKGFGVLDSAERIRRL